jgi:hypothetical protein
VAPAITYNGHPVQIVQVWPTRNVTGEPLLTIRSLNTDREWEVWEFELKGDYRVIKKDVEKVERRRALRR